MKRIGTAFVLAACIVILASCNGNVSLKSIKTGVTLFIHTQEGKDLTVEPEYAPAYYRYTAVNSTGAGQGAVTDWTDLDVSNGRAELEGLSRGIWVFSVRAYTETGKPVFEGSGETVLKVGVQNSVEIVLKGKTGGGTGSLDIGITSPAKRGVGTNSLEIRYLGAGEEVWQSVVLTKDNLYDGLSDDAMYYTWTRTISPLDEGDYDVVITAKQDGTSVCEKVFSVQICADETTSISGGFDRDSRDVSYDTPVDFIDLIDIVERAQCTGMIIGFRDALTGYEFTQDILEKDSSYTLRNCPVENAADGTLESLGIEPLYKTSQTPSSYIKLLMVTSSCDSLPASGISWVGGSAGEEKKVQTIYINKNITKRAFYNVLKLKRIFLGTSEEFTSIEELSFFNIGAVTILSIPPNIKTLEDRCFDFNGILRGRLSIYCPFAKEELNKYTFSPYDIYPDSGDWAGTMHWETTYPMSQL